VNSLANEVQGILNRDASMHEGRLLEAAEREILQQTAKVITQQEQGRNTDLALMSRAEIFQAAIEVLKREIEEEFALGSTARRPTDPDFVYSGCRVAIRILEEQVDLGKARQ
jgi:hypothetical protein